MKSETLGALELAREWHRRILLRADAAEKKLFEAKAELELCRGALDICAEETRRILLESEQVSDE